MTLWSYWPTASAGWSPSCCAGPPTGGQRLARQRRKRLFVFALVSLLAGLVVALVVPRQEVTFGPAYRGAYLLLAVTLGYLVSCLWSPVTAVRDLVRPLLSWRLSWDRYAFALLVWPLVGAATLVVSGLLGPRAAISRGAGRDSATFPAYSRRVSPC